MGVHENDRLRETDVVVRVPEIEPPARQDADELVVEARVLREEAMCWICGKRWNA